MQTPSRFVLSAVLALSPLMVLAQWTTSGPHIYNTNSGNVGIGTSTPPSKLYVTGTYVNETADRVPATVLTLQDTIGANNSFGSSFFKTGWNNVGPNANSGILTIAVGRYPSYQSGFDVLTLLGTGKVGIGTTTPYGTLSVSGTLSPLANFFKNSSNYAQLNTAEGFFSLKTDNNSAPAFSLKGAGTANLVDVFDDSVKVFTILDGGNVGIGTSTPSSKLEVDGDVKISGNLVSDGDICIGECE